MWKYRVTKSQYKTKSDSGIHSQSFNNGTSVSVVGVKIAVISSLGAALVVKPDSRIEERPLTLRM